MKIFIPARHGLGDMINLYFIHPATRHLLKAIECLYTKGTLTEVLLLHEEFISPPESVESIFGNLPFPVSIVSTHKAHDLCPEVEISAGNNSFPEQIDDYINILCLHKYLPLDGYPGYIPIPIKSVEKIPEDFILFAPLAGLKERCLTDGRIMETIKRLTNLPVIITGMQTKRNEFCESGMLGDYNMIGSLSLRETFYIASKAKVIIAGLSLMRTCSSLFNVPVIELYEGNDETVIKRTNAEYQRGFYGMKPDKNFCYLWDLEKRGFRARIVEILTR